ncbi:MAG: hypothetical protein JST00_36200 [Deltaproteobacteria bacterium]|nr:hypothetical protein [Deltaproteobacteria bacterium]
MKTSRIARLLAATAPLFAATLWACSGGPDASNSSESNVESSDLEIHFPKMYSAFAPGHEFKIPAAVEGVKNVKWSVSDDAIADIEKQEDGSAMITARQAGTVDIIAKAGGLVGRAQLVISAATAEEWEAGNQRYNNGIVLKRGEGKNREAGAPPPSDPSRKQAACTNCHSGASAGNESADVEHTPMQTAGYTDQQLIDIFTKGTKPAGVPQRIMMSKDRWKKIHQWEMDELAVKGVVVYLRSLEPKSQGETDFGGWGHGKGDGGGGGKGSSSGTGSSQ